MWHNTPIASRLHPAYRFVFKYVRRSRLMARYLFGVRSFPTRGLLYWDWVTLGIRRAFRQFEWSNLRFLDMGCGFAGILSIHAHHLGCRNITAVDIVPECVESARRFLEANHVPAVIEQSDMTSTLAGQHFDVIAFNSTYIPENWGKQQLLHHELPRGVPPTTKTWSGGADGLDSIRKYVQNTPEILAEEGTMLLGFNKFYVRVEAVKDIVTEAGLETKDNRTYCIGPTVVLTLQRPRKETNHV